MNFSDYTFGFADADTEFVRIDDYFDKVFLDYHNSLNKITSGFPFIIVGRKGVGKSAYCSKIRSLKNEPIYSFYLPLNEFEYSTFAKLSTDKDIEGNQKYKHSWNFLLLSLVIKALNDKMNITEPKQMEDALNMLSRLGFPINFDYPKIVSTLSKLKAGVNLGVFDASYETEFGEKPSNYLDRISTLNEYLIDKISNIDLSESRLLLLVDGVDDVLKIKKNRLDILNSLVCSINYLNKEFIVRKTNVKLLIFIREEIFSLLNDTDMNKIKRDSSIRIDWYNNTDDLKEIIKLRMMFSGVSDQDVDSELNSMFPLKVKDKPFWDYLLEYTLYKPRDVIQFFICCQELFGKKDVLSFSEVNQVIKHYSSQYFIDEMKNGLSGFVKDELILILPSVFTRISTKSFSLAEFTQIVEKQMQREYDENDIKSLLFTLYETGYIGQLINTGRGAYSRSSVQFKYRNPSSSLDYNNLFLVHRGITVGLGIKL